MERWHSLSRRVRAQPGGLPQLLRGRVGKIDYIASSSHPRIQGNLYLKEKREEEKKRRVGSMTDRFRMEVHRFWKLFLEV